MKTLKTFLKIIFLLSIVCLTVSFFLKDKLPDSSTIQESLQFDPIQKMSGLDQITMEKDGYISVLDLRYSYEISGLVVEEYDSEVWHDVMHKDFDPFNTYDVCLLWGVNVEDNLYHEYKFKHGEFTCSFQAQTREAQMAFNKDQISNNHLIPANDEIYRKIKNSSISDQIRIKGYLADYSITTPDGRTGSRSTSVSRGDIKNEACEVIYVEEYEVIKKGNYIFALMYDYSIFTLVFSFLALVFLFVSNTYRTIGRISSRAEGQEGND